MKAKNDQHQQKIAELTEALQRERADAINVRRRAEEDKLKMAGFFKAFVIKELLAPLENLERAVKLAPENDEWAKGVIGIKKQFNDSLAKLGVVKIDALGKPFNAELHEAISMEDGDGEIEIVSEELQTGWMIDGEVIRPSMVRVTRKAADV